MADRVDCNGNTTSAKGGFGYFINGLAAVILLVFLAGPGIAEGTVPKTPTVAEADASIWASEDSKDVRLAQEFLETAAAQGDADAQRVLGAHLLNGWVLEQDIARGISLLESAVRAGNSGAQTELAQTFLWGTHTAADTDRARDLLEMAIDEGDPEAMRILGEQLVSGGIYARDTANGLALLERAVANGHIKAGVTLGELLVWGKGVDRDPDRALVLFEDAAQVGEGAGLATYGEDLMWRRTDPAAAEEMLVRAGELGASKAWVTLANGAMYGYLGSGRVSRAKFDGYAEKARMAGEEQIAVLEATRNMWGISMRASGPETIGQLTTAADNGNATAAKFLIGILRDGNDLNLFRRPAHAKAALEKYSPLLSETERAQFELTVRAASSRTRSALEEIARSYDAHPELRSSWFGKELASANLNAAFYILQQQLQRDGLYRGPINGYATRTTLNALYRACRTLDKPERCDDNVMRSDVIADLLARG